MLRVESDEMDYAILVPTDMSEITQEDIDNLLKGVHVPQYYCVIALLYKARPYSVVSDVAAKKQSDMQVIPILAKTSEGVETVGGSKVGDKVIVDRSSLERSHLVVIPENTLTPNYVGTYCNSDKELAKSIILGSYFNDGTVSDFTAKNNAPDWWFLDFRILPMNDIVGGYDKDVKRETPFKVAKENILNDEAGNPLLN